MATLFTTTPTFIRLNGRQWFFYYRVPNGDVGALPLGSAYAIVSSPSTFMTEPRWMIRRYEIRPSSVRGEESKSHCAVGGRDLMVEEITYFKNLIAQLKEGDYATPKSFQAPAQVAEVQGFTGGAEGGEVGEAAPADWTSEPCELEAEPEWALDLQGTYPEVARAL